MSLAKFAAYSSLALGVNAVASSDTKAMPCYGSATDLSKCYFSGDYCSYYSQFTDFPRAIYWDQYPPGDPTKYDFIIESGLPANVGGYLNMPLNKPASGAYGTPTIMSTTRFLNYGSFEARLKTVGIASVVTAFIGISNVLDEIDFEFTPKGGLANTDVQANWYSKGSPTYNVNFQDTHVANDTFNNFHTYRVDWNPDNITWYADGASFYVQTKASLGINASQFPDTPMRIQFGVWHAQDNQWAGANAVNFNANPPQQLDVMIDYIKVIGADCGGGFPNANPPLSAGFQNRPLPPANSYDPKNPQKSSSGGFIPSGAASIIMSPSTIMIATIILGVMMPFYFFR